MDPPQEGDEDDGRMGGIQRLELMEQLGLGEGTRVVDLQVRGEGPRSTNSENSY